MKNLILATLLAGPGAAFGQLIFQPLSIHPANVAPGGEFLIAVEDRWPNGCAGEVSIEVSADAIDVLAVAASEDNRQLCTQAFEPFADLLRPRAGFAGTFADQVSINYDFVAPDGQRERRASATLNFSDAGNELVTVETGSWITEDLQSSGLFIDQQGDLFSANLADYFQGSGAWFFGAAPVVGDMVVAQLSRYVTIVCVTAPCDRAAPEDSGTLLAVLKNRNRLLVKYENILDTADATPASALNYRRLDLDRAAGLEGVPDLEGRWIVGVGPGTDTGLASAMAVFDLSPGSTAPVGGLETTTFAARNINRLDASIEPDFVVQCQDARPVDGELTCSINNLTLGEGQCTALFPFDDAGLRRVDGTAACSGLDGEFLMIRP